MDTRLLAEASMGLMDSLDGSELENGDIVACGIVVIIEHEGHVFTRTYNTEKIYHRAVGLFAAAQECIGSGESIRPDETDPE
jgi:hypothetical protein